MQVFASSEAQQKAYIQSAGLPLLTKDDLAEDFSSMVEAIKMSGKSERFNSEQLEIISNINRYFDQKSGDVDVDFWCIGTRSCIEGWEEVRVMAKEYLAIEGTNEVNVFADPRF